MEQATETKIINGYLVKNWCVVCDQFMPISWANFQMRGNFCAPCTAAIEKKAKQNRYKYKISF